MYPPWSWLWGCYLYRPGCSFRLNLVEAEGERQFPSWYFAVLEWYPSLLILSHQVHTNTGCFPEKGRAKWRLLNMLDATSACYITGCLSSTRDGTQLSKDVLRFQHSSVFQALPLGCILLKTSGHLPHLARPQLLQLQENTQPPLFSHLGPNKGKEIIFFFFAFCMFLLPPLYFPFSMNPQTPFAFQAFGLFLMKYFWEILPPVLSFSILSCLFLINIQWSIPGKHDADI